MSNHVLADAQFGIAKILRPYAGFDAQDTGGGVPLGSYQGKDGGYPILFTEGGQALDEAAGEEGYSPNLVRGVQVPYGSRITLWMPMLPIREVDAVPNSYEVSWSWRMRNVYDFRQRRIPYHYPKQSAGVPFGGQSRVIIPSATQSVVYNQNEPTTVSNGIVATAGQNVHAESMLLSFSQPFRKDPLLPGTASFGTISQGLSPVEPSQVEFAVLELQATGDELVIGYSKPAGLSAWDFTAPQPANNPPLPGGADYLMSAAFGALSKTLNPPNGFPDWGIYVLAGSAP